MAVQDRLFGYSLSVALVGITVNLLQYFTDIELNLDVTMMEARTPHDSVVNTGAHYPRPKSRRLDITVSGMVPGEDLALVGGIAPDNLFDNALAGGSADCPFTFNSPALHVTGVGIVTGADLDAPGEAMTQSIRLTARSYTGHILKAGITAGA